MRVQLEFSLEDPLSSLKWSLPSKQEEESLPAPMRKKQLSWNLHYPRLPPTPTILHTPYSCAQTLSPCVKPSSPPILEHSQSTIPSTSYHIPISFNGSLAILQFQVMIQPTKQPKNLPPLPLTPFLLFLYQAPSKSLMRRFVTLHQHTNGLLLCTNIEGVLEMQNRSTTEKMTFSLLIYNPAINLLSSNTFTDLILHKICPNCRLEENDLLHWSCECLALITTRNRVFGYKQGSLEWLAT